MSVDAQNVVDFEDGLNKVFDWIEGLKQLPPPRDVEDPLALAEWFREFHQLSRTVLALPDTDLLRRFAQDVELALGQRQEGPPQTAADRVLWQRPSIFRVLVTKDGGAAGSDAADCSFTYGVTSCAGATLGAGMTPKRPRLTKVEYEEPSAASPGLGYYDSDGAFQLYEAIEEFPKETTC